MFANYILIFSQGFFSYSSLFTLSCKRTGILKKKVKFNNEQLGWNKPKLISENQPEPEPSLNL